MSSVLRFACSRCLRSAVPRGRGLASYEPTPEMSIFDRKVKLKQRDFAASLKNADDYDVIHDQVAWLVADRVNDIARKFPLALDIGCRRGHVGKYLDKESVEVLIQCDSSKKMLENPIKQARDWDKVVHCDEENMKFEENQFDLITSSLSLHWVNNLPKVLKQARHILKPDGAFVAAMFGEETLYELRSSLQLAEEERRGGFSQHISPFTQLRDIGSLLTESGFTLLTVDIDEVIVTYPSIFELVSDLKNMGENNATFTRSKFLSNETMLAAAAIYQEMYGDKEKQTIPATYEVIHMVAWKPHQSQPKPLERGSATHSLKDLGKLSQKS